MFKTAVDKYVLATVRRKLVERTLHYAFQTTVQAFCTVFQSIQSEKESRAKAIQAQATLAKSLARVNVGLHKLRCNLVRPKYFGSSLCK